MGQRTQQKQSEFEWLEMYSGDLMVCYSHFMSKRNLLYVRKIQEGVVRR